MNIKTFIVAFTLMLALTVAPAADARVVKAKPQNCPQPISYISDYTVTTVVPVTYYREYSVRYTMPSTPVAPTCYYPMVAPAPACAPHGNVPCYTARGCVSGLLRCPFRLLNTVEYVLFGD